MRETKNEKKETQRKNNILPFHWKFGEEEITLKVSSYAYGNGLAILMYSQTEGELELFDDLTVNLPGGYGLEPQEQAHSGFASYTPVAFDLSRLARYDREGVEEFCRQWGLDMPKEPEKIQGKPAGRKKRERER